MAQYTAVLPTHAVCRIMLYAESLCVTKSYTRVLYKDYATVSMTMKYRALLSMANIVPRTAFILDMIMSVGILNTADPGYCYKQLLFTILSPATIHGYRSSYY